MVDDSAHESAVRLYKFPIKDKKVARLPIIGLDWGFRCIARREVGRGGGFARIELCLGSESCAGYLFDRLLSGKRTEIYPDGRFDRIKCDGHGTIRDFMCWRLIRAIRDFLPLR